MSLTINVLWDKKQYGLMYKMSWQQEIDLANLPRISLKTPFEQAKSTAKFLFNFSKKWVDFAWKTIKNIHKNTQKLRKYRSIKQPIQTNIYEREKA